MGLDSVEWVMRLEHEFGIQIPDSAAEQMLTVGNALDYLESRTVTSKLAIGSPAPRVEIKSRVADVTSRLFRIAPERITPTTHLVRDLGAD